MKIIDQSAEILDVLDGQAILKKIELCGRTCYKSCALIDAESAEKFVRKLIDNKHESVLEHVNVTVKLITNRSVSHQLVRHRIASYSQESQRYCNYSKSKFNNEVVFIKPLYFVENTDPYQMWLVCCETAETDYFSLLNDGCSPQQAREVLPNCTKTELIMTCNLRQWRNIFKQRTSDAADESTRELMRSLLEDFKSKIPVIFDDIL